MGPFGLVTITKHKKKPHPTFNTFFFFVMFGFNISNAHNNPNLRVKTHFTRIMKIRSLRVTHETERNIAFFVRYVSTFIIQSFNPLHIQNEML